MKLKWCGRWLGSFVGKPDPEEFIWNNNEFEYISNNIDINDIIINNQLRPPSSICFEGYYMMDATGTGKHVKYYDKQFFVEFQQLENTDDTNDIKYFVLGKGDSEFGPFLLSGTYCVSTKLLDMSRQYMDPNKIKNGK